MSEARRLLLTGTSSFVGAHLAARLAQSGYTVTALHSAPLETYDELRRARLDHAAAAGARLVHLDVTEGHTLAALIATERPRYCIHHAGWAARYGAIDYDMEMAHRVNVAPLPGLYAALAANGCKGVIMTGTSMEYSATDGACAEDDACVPDTPYGISKLAQTLRARQLGALTGLPTRVVRLFIPFGRLDAPSKILPSLRAALREGRPMDLSPCTQTRDFSHVDDICAGYGAILKHLPETADGSFEIFNLCGGPTRLADFLLQLAGKLGADPSLLRFGAIAMRAGEAPFSYGSNAKAQRLLGWSPRPLSDVLGAYVRETD